MACISEKVTIADGMCHSHLLDTLNDVIRNNIFFPTHSDAYNILLTLKVKDSPNNLVALSPITMQTMCNVSNQATFWQEL